MLRKSAKVSRWAYNWTIDRQITNYKNGGKFIEDGELRKEITLLKREENYKWLKEVSAQIPKQSIKDACLAYKRFFNGVSKFPKFKSHNSKMSFYNDNVRLKVKEMSVLIEKVGWIKTAEQIPMNVKYRNPRVTFDGKYWYISVSIDYPQKEVHLTDDIIGIDLGVSNLAVLSNGIIYPNINKSEEIRRLTKKLKRMQRKVSRKYQMNKLDGEFVKTKNILKIEREIRLVYRRIANIRNNNMHQITNAIAKSRPKIVVMEDLNVKGMLKNRYLAKAIHEQGFGEFTRQMEYKCKKYGIEFIQADRFFPSSKLCSSCGQVRKDLKLSDRVYKCNCGLVIDRDLNAAINLANYGR